MIKKINNSLGLSRDDLPQILNREDFIAWVRAQSLAVSYVPVPYASLTASQGEYNSEKVDNFGNSSLAYIVGKPLIVSRDHYILDGHHRWLAAMEMLPSVVGWSYVVDLTFEELLALTKTYSGAVFKKITESSKDAEARSAAARAARGER